MKLLLQSLLAFSVMLSTSACDRFLKGNKSPSEEPVKIRPQEFSCLTNWSDQVRKYFRDELSEKETRDIFTCLDGSINIFKTFTRGQIQNVYTDHELRQFLNRYLMGDRQISASFIAEIMNLKVFLLGGTKNTISASEIQKIHDVVMMFSDEAVQLRGNWKILLLTEKRENVRVEDLAVANTLAKSSLLRVISQSQASTSQFSFRDLKSIIEEASVFVKNTDTISNLTKWMELADSIRHLFVGESTAELTQSEWYSVGRWSVDAYGLMLSYYYHMVNFNTGLSESWHQMFKFIDRAISLVENSPQMKKNGILEVRGVDAIIDELEKTKVLPFSLTPSTLKDTYRHIFASMLQSKRLGVTAWQYVKGLEKQDLELIKHEYNVWKLSQTGLIQIFNKNSALKFDDLRTQLSSLTSAKILSRTDIKTEATSDLDTSWTEFLALLNSPHPLAIDTYLKLTIPTYATGKTVSLRSMSLLNSLRTLVRFVFTGYGVQRTSNPWQAVMTQTGMSSWEEDFRNFGIEIKFLDKREPGAGIRTFNEARFFSFSSVGGYELSAMQMMEQLTMMISGGMGAAEDLMTLLEKSHCNTTLRDSGFDRPIANEACFDKVFVQNFSSVFENLPALTREVTWKRLNVQQVLALVKQISYRKTKIAGTVEYAEIRTMGGVLHYLESLFESFDIENTRQFLNEREILRAYPRFASVVQAVSPLKNFLPEDAFLYVVYKGEIPKTDGFGIISAACDFTGFLTQKNTIGLGEVPRTNLLKVITLLK